MVATITLSTGQAEKVTAAASVASESPDPNSSNNAASQETTVQAPCIVPDVEGKPLPAAKKAIARAHCATGKVTRKYSKKIRRGRVISQSLAASTRFPPLTKVNLVVSRGPKPKRR